MSEKRKDHKGRILKAGESQRKDGIYQYRYTDCRGKRQCVYSPTLQELRQKEKEIQKQIDDGIDYEAGQITVIELLEKYISLKKGVRYNTQVGYRFVLNLVRKEDFGYRKISTVKISDAKQWFAKLQKDGRGFSTISSVRGVIKPAFQMAYDEDAVRKNPFVFKLTDVVVNDTVPRAALTEEHLGIWMNFIEKDNTYHKYYNEFVVLLETGMRVSDADGKISLNQQKPSKHAGLRRFGPEKFLQRNNEFMKERPIFYKKPIKTEKDFSTWLRCFYYTTKAVITEYIYF